MIRTGRSVLLGLVLVAAAACGGGDAPSGSESEPAARRGAGAAVEGAMCAEHGVLEAVCTQCNPKLVPVFQAKGDWCEEHGFPESFCPICHPEREGRPAVDVGGEGPAHGTKVRFETKRAAELAGIETEPAESVPGGARLETIATVVYDAARHAAVNARSPGVVQRLAVDVGTQVEKGDVLAAVESAAVGADRSRLRSAAAQVEVARAAYDREVSLRDKGIAAEKEVLAARRDWEAAKAQLGAARAALGMVGAGGDGASGYLLRAPIGGTVTQRNATIGHMLGTDEIAFEIVDTSEMWVELDVPEDRLAVVRPGQAVSVRLDSMPDRDFRGTIDYLAPSVDPRTRTAKARVPLENPEGLLRANLYGRAFIELGEAKPTVLVPRKAVQRAGEVTLVFVRLAEDVFETRRVKVGRTEGDRIEILEGVEPGEPVATTGSFLLKTETLAGAIGAGCCEVE